MANNQNSVCRFSVWPNGFLDLIFPSSFQLRFQTEIFTKFGWYSWLYWTWWHQPNCSAITKLLVFYYLTNISDFIISYNCVKFLKSFLIVGRVSSIIFVLPVWITAILGCKLIKCNFSFTLVHFSILLSAIALFITLNISKLCSPLFYVILFRAPPTLDKCDKFTINLTIQPTELSAGVYFCTFFILKLLKRIKRTIIVCQ